MNQQDIENAGFYDKGQPDYRAARRAKPSGCCRAAVTGSLVLLFALLSACGNKGPLYLEIDQDTLRELEELSQEIQQAEEEAKDSRKKDSGNPTSKTTSDE